MRVSATVGQMSSVEVDSYIASLPTRQREALEQLRAAITSAAPDAEEVITYKMPGFRLNGRFFVSYDAYKSHFSLFPSSEGVEKALGDEAPLYVRGRGTLQFRYEAPPPAELVRRIIKARLADLQSEKG
jgi:uncharacterized protein YdhG (YjbR/CyaY superfamily)